MNDRLGILFLHHHVDRVVTNNLRNIRLHNPDAVVATISAGAPLPGGYTMEPTPRLKWLHSTKKRHSSDRLVCSWFVQRKEVCDKWWIVEWDTFCNMPVRDYYRPVWNFPFVASSIRLPNREPEWDWFVKARRESWFGRAKKIPDGYKPFMTGMVPFLCLLSEAALKATCTMLLENSLTAGNGELRFATAASRCGYAPCGFSPPNDQITWMTWKTLPPKPAIVHPVKHFVES
jgi:hypothetical protein